jgi:hypothetical protein
MSDGNSIINLGDLTRPATILIEKISDAVGGLFKPYQVVRVAKAEAEADLIKAENQIQITDLHRRAMHRFVEEEAKCQANIESITGQALPLLNEKAAPQNVADDWITNFFDKCRIVSDADMQQLWARVLAGEANSPGTFAKRTVNLLADLDRSDAELFTHLCGFNWTICGLLIPLTFDVKHNVYNNEKLDFDALSHLDSLGLIKFNGIGVYTVQNQPKKTSAFYYDRTAELTLKNEMGNNIPAGHTMLTQAGQQLASFCGSRPVEGFFEYVCLTWMESGVICNA